jgi:hypothetical protein
LTCDSCPDCGSTATTCWDCKDRAIAELEKERDEARKERDEALRERDEVRTELQERDDDDDTDIAANIPYKIGMALKARDDALRALDLERAAHQATADRLENLRYNRRWTREDIEAMEQKHADDVLAIAAECAAERKAEKERDDARRVARCLCDFADPNEVEKFLATYPWLKGKEA